MKIRKKTDKIIAFNDIERGEIFNHAGDYYLKINNIIGIGDDDYNSVHVITGKPDYFSPETGVIKVNAELIIHD